MKLSLEEVRHVARLARLSLSPDEETRYQRQLSAILLWADQLREVDTSGIAPTARAADLSNLLRPDDPGPSLPPEAALANAPDRAGSSLSVPRIIE